MFWRRKKWKNEWSLTQEERDEIGENLKIEHVLRGKIAKLLYEKYDLSEDEAREGAFHLTDWYGDLVKLYKLYESESWDPDHAIKIIIKFVNHAPAHMVAAYRTIWGEPLEDVFAIGDGLGDGKGERKPGEPDPPTQQHGSGKQSSGTLPDS